MADDSPLIVTPAGTATVATDGLLAALDRLRALADAAERELVAAARVRALQDWVDVAGASPWARNSSWRLRSAEASLLLARDRALWLAASLRMAIEGYDAVEAGLQRFTRLEGAVLGWAVGTGVGVGLLDFRIALALIEWLGGQDHALAGLMILMTRDGSDGGGDVVGEWFAAHPQVVTSPAFVEAVRLVASSSDDAAEGFDGVPLPVSLLLGDDALGLTGVATGVAWQVRAGHQFGVLEESPTVATLQRTATGGVPAAGTAQRFDRVPPGDQVRVERYQVPGGPPRYVVYVGPTDAFDVTHTPAAEDETSNHYGVAGLSSGAIRATQEAMGQAGIRPGDEVQLVGYSQGGLVAARIAASDDWNVVGLETFGAPTGNVALPDRVHGIAIRNTDDLVPALAGQQVDHHLVQAERQAYPDPSSVPHVIVPAHQRDAYRATANTVDAADSSAVRDANAALDAFTHDYVAQGATVTTSVYALVRPMTVPAVSGGTGSHRVVD